MCVCGGHRDQHLYLFTAGASLLWPQTKNNSYLLGNCVNKVVQGQSTRKSRGIWVTMDRRTRRFGVQGKGERGLSFGVVTCETACFHS